MWKNVYLELSAPVEKGSRLKGSHVKKRKMSLTVPVTNQNFSRKLRETTKVTARSKLLIISEDCYDNLRSQHIEISQMHLDNRPEWKFREFR